MMETLEDAQWYRVAGLSPRLRSHVRMHRRVTRGRVWYLLGDDQQRRYHRLDDAAWQLVGRLDGTRTVEDVWRQVHAQLGQAAPSQAEVVQLLSQLASAELLAQHPLLDPAHVVSRRRKRQQQLRAASLNPLSFKLPLFDPTQLLRHLMPLARRLFTPGGAAAWTLLLLAAAWVAGSRWGELSHALNTHARSTGFLLQVWLAYPLVKTLHEACHAMAVRVWGGEVREVGLTLMLLTPLPYVDASAATAFASRRRRVLVSAAGVMAELAVAAAALLLWAAASEPALQRALLAVAAGCGLSTLLFNANPLARFDGYYVLCDLLDLPNLAQRANAVLAHAGRRLLGAAQADAPASSRRAALLLGGYALLAGLYRVGILAAAAWWLSASHPVAAGALAAFGALWMGAPALLGSGRFLLLDRRLDGRRARALALAAGLPVLACAALFAVPMPSYTLQQGVVWAAPEAIVRTPVNGELRELAVQDGQHVAQGQRVATLENLELLGERAKAASLLQTLEARYYHALQEQTGDAARAAPEREAARATLARLDERLDELTLHAPSAGTLVMVRNTGQPGHFYPQGKELGYILPERPGVLVKVALSEAQASLVRQRTQAVSVQFADGRRAAHARLDRETPEMTALLPNAVFGSASGGPVPVDPADAEGRRTLAPVALVDVRIAGEAARSIGARAWVRFDHGREPIGRQWLRSLRQSFLGALALGSP